MNNATQTTSSKRYALINTSSTFDDIKGKESLDAALILASYEMDVSLFFIGNGVYQTLVQQPKDINAKDYVATFKALEFYDIESIYICEESLQERSLPLAANIPNSTIIPSDQMKGLLADFDVILTF